MPLPLLAPLQPPRAEAVLRVVEQELPESAALLRLSGMEVTECLSEVHHWREGVWLRAGGCSLSSAYQAVRGHRAWRLPSAYQRG